MYYFVAHQNDSRVKGNILLNVKRAPVSSRTCAYPFCIEQDNTRLISIEIRSKVMHELRFYIPPRSVACQDHRMFVQWKEDDIRDFDLIPYTVANIEEMIDLLRFKPKCLKYDISGEHKGMLFMKTS